MDFVPTWAAIAVGAIIAVVVIGLIVNEVISALRRKRDDGDGLGQ